MVESLVHRPTNTTRDVHLALLRYAIAQAPYEGYPDAHDRFFAHTIGHEALHELTIPADGPWVVDAHPNRPDTESIPSPERQQELLATGFRLDTLGRPVHPWLEAMLTDRSIGVISGKGAYWKWGPNPTADALVTHTNHILLIQRHDTGLWAVPGGFQDAAESASTAAARELREETGLTVSDHDQGEVIYTGPVADPRITAHAWPETTAVLYRLKETDTLPVVSAEDDAAAAMWVPKEALAQYPMFGSHRWLARRALEYTPES